MLWTLSLNIGIENTTLLPSIMYSVIQMFIAVHNQIAYCYIKRIAMLFQTKTGIQLYFWMKICENLCVTVMFMTFDFRSRVTFDIDNIFDINVFFI